jgi:hypothetical protein
MQATFQGKNNTDGRFDMFVKKNVLAEWIGVLVEDPEALQERVGQQADAAAKSSEELDRQSVSTWNQGKNDHREAVRNAKSSHREAVKSAKAQKAQTVKDAAAQKSQSAKDSEKQQEQSKKLAARANALSKLGNVLGNS